MIDPEKKWNKMISHIRVPDMSPAMQNLYSGELWAANRIDELELKEDMLSASLEVTKSWYNVVYYELEETKRQLKQLQDKHDKLCDSNYRAGFFAGWNAAIRGDEKLKARVGERCIDK